MALGRTQREQMTDFEREEFEQEKTVTQMQLEHTQALKRMELEIAKVEAKWTTIFKIPLTIINLPVKIFLAIGYIISMKKDQPDEEFWSNIWKN